jgi:hypothetical protein
VWLFFWWFSDVFFQDIEVYAFVCCVMSFVQGVDDSAYRNLLLDLNDALDNLRVTYKVDDAQKEFAATELHYEYVKTRSGAQTLVKKYSGENPTPRFLDHHTKRKFKAAASELDDESSELSGTLQPAA